MIKPVQFGTAAGIIWGLCIFICTILAIYTGYSEAFLNVMKSVYVGYKICWGGAFLGLLYGFIDGFVGFGLIAWIYNLLCGPEKKPKRRK